MSYETPIDNGPSSLQDAQAIEIAELTAEVKRLRVDNTELKTFIDTHRHLHGFDKLSADKLAATVDEWVRRGMLGSRTILADARLDYGEPFPEEQVRKVLESHVSDERAEVERLRKAMEAVASMPGREWLAGQLALGEALRGGGENLDYVLRLMDGEASDTGDAQ